MGDAGGGKEYNVAGVEVDDEAGFVEDQLAAAGSIEISRDVHRGGSVGEVEGITVAVAYGLRSEVASTRGKGRPFVRRS